MTVTNKRFAISGVLHTIVLLGVELVCLLSLKMRVDGLLWANIISNAAVIGYLNIGIHFEKRIRISRFNSAKLRELLKFSIPLIPNSICWWFVSLCDKYVIAIFLGTSANGIYAVSNKFPQLITFATSVFQLAWQESAIMEANSEERDRFYSGIFNQYLRLLCSAFIAGIFAIRIVMPYIVDAKFADSLLYVPPLLFSTVFSAFSQFYGTSYLVSKKTSGVFTTTLISAVVNLAVCLSLIKIVGLWAAPLSTCCAYLVQWIVRDHQLRGEFKVRIDWKTFIPLLLLMLLLSGLYYIVNDLALQIIVLFIAVCIALFINWKTIKNIVTEAFEMLKSR
ncbi:MAG: polysaccharide biosynthesis C-terminal domain-containing protein [Sphaerochaetaceae bacterium]